MTLDQLHRQHYKDFIKKIYPYLNNYAAAEEVVQDAFVYALERISQFDPLKSQLKTWFTKILFSRLWNEKRKNKKTPKTCELESIAESCGVNNPASSNISSLILAVKNVRHQHVLFCHFVLGNSYVEVSDITGYTEDNVRKIVQRFRETVL